MTIVLELTQGSCSQTYIPVYLPAYRRLRKHYLPSPSVGRYTKSVQIPSHGLSLLSRLTLAVDIVAPTDCETDDDRFAHLVNAALTRH